MGLFDWLGGRRQRESVPAAAWHVYRAAGDIVAEDGRGANTRVPLARARSVGIVQLTGPGGLTWNVSDE